jgi:hypothetical protein
VLRSLRTGVTGHHIPGMARKPDKLHENFRKALEEAPLYSPLGKWMTQHRDELEALFSEGEPDWTAMAEVFDKAGLRDEAERRPTAGSTERTWRIVQAAAAPKSAASAASPAARAKGRGQPRRAGAASR